MPLSAIALPSPSAPPSAAMDTANAASLGKNHEVLPEVAAWVSCAMALATVNNNMANDIKNNLVLIIELVSEAVNNGRRQSAAGSR